MQSKQKLIKYKICEKKPKIETCYIKQRKEHKKKGFLGNGLRMQTEACIRKPNPTYVGFDLRTHAHGTHMQGYSKP